MAELRNPHWSKIKNPEKYAKRMSEKERILFIREYGSDVQKDGLKAIFHGNKWKPKPNRENVWKRTGRGWKMVRTIVKRKTGRHFKSSSSKPSTKPSTDSNTNNGKKAKGLSNF